MKKIISLLAFACIAMLFVACNKDKKDVTSPTDGKAIIGKFPMNPPPPAHLPPATVQLKYYDWKNAGILHGNTTPMITPSTFNNSVILGQTICEDITLHLPPRYIPAKGDILFCFDLTGSMGEELANVKVNSLNIMNSIQGLISDSKFGVISHMDYPSTYSYCDYYTYYGGVEYGSSYYGDYPYAMNQSITSNLTDVQTAINNLNLGAGSDYPEDYTRTYYEAWHDNTIGFRTGATKFLVAFMDAVPHDCNYGEIIDISGTMGADPGPDGIVGNGDDLYILNELDNLKAHGIIPIFIFSGYEWDGVFPLWQAYANRAGGHAFQTYPDGTIPSGTDIATYITGLISGSIAKFDNISLQVCNPAYSGWLLSVNPSSKTNVVLGEDQDLNFNLCIKPPAGTAPGTYTFDVCAIGDGSELAKQTVTVTVYPTTMDIKPTSCPNPLNYKDNGKLPVAILGTAYFNVSDIKISSIKLEGLAPVENTISDVAGPYTGSISGCYDCNTAGPDGYSDLTLKFKIQDLIKLLGTTSDRDCKILTLTGELNDGTPFKLSDIVRIQK